jgi:hypothetical protein
LEKKKESLNRQKERDTERKGKYKERKEREKNIYIYFALYSMCIPVRPPPYCIEI